jgi:ParB family chromosome partitioning protein
MGVSKKLLTPSVIDAVVEKVSQKRITNSKDLRKLRAILPDPVARENFLSEEGDLETASLRISAVRKQKGGSLPDELDAAVDAMKRVPWTALAELKGDPKILRKERVWRTKRWNRNFMRQCSRSIGERKMKRNTMLRAS